MGRLGRQFGMANEAQHAQPVLHSDHDNTALCQFLAVE